MILLSHVVLVLGVLKQIVALAEGSEAGLAGILCVSHAALASTGRLLTCKLQGMVPESNKQELAAEGGQHPRFRVSGSSNHRSPKQKKFTVWGLGLGVSYDKGNITATSSALGKLAANWAQA